MMFCGEDHLSDTSRLRFPYPLPGIQMCWVKARKVFLPIAPLPVREGIDPKVKKGRQLQLLPTQLPGGRNHMSGLPDDIGRIIGRGDRNIILAKGLNRRRQLPNRKNKYS